jgi:hypothetical protein
LSAVAAVAARWCEEKPAVGLPPRRACAGTAPAGGAGRGRRRSSPCAASSGSVGWEREGAVGAVGRPAAAWAPPPPPCPPCPPHLELPLCFQPPLELAELVDPLGGACALRRAHDARVVARRAGAVGARVAVAALGGRGRRRHRGCGGAARRRPGWPDSAPTPAPTLPLPHGRSLPQRRPQARPGRRRRRGAGRAACVARLVLPRRRRARQPGQ